MGALCEPYESSMRALCELGGGSMGARREPHESSMGAAWEPDGSHMGDIRELYDDGDADESDGDAADDGYHYYYY